MTRLNISSSHNYNQASYKQILHRVNEVVTIEVKRSTLFDKKKENAIPRFSCDEIVQGNVLGKGGFCVVRELNEIKINYFHNADVDDNDCCSNNSNTSTSSVVSLSRRRQRQTCNVQRNIPLHKSLSPFGGSTRHIQINPQVESLSSRECLAHRLWHAQKGQQQQQMCQYVVKQVDPDLFETNRVLFLKGTIDLALETKYLASLCHPHILALRGVCRKKSSKGIGYYVIVDNLPELLTHRLTSWIHQYRTTRGITGLVTRGRKRASTLEIERLLVAYDIASAIYYLHSKNIVYRDLKPDNIGFDIDGILKVFDFGLAKELVIDERTEDGLYNMTGMTGSLRYMAPEVALNEPYDVRADVYSWSMVFWYIMALEPPLELYSPSVFVSHVAIDGDRPEVHKKWSTYISGIMQMAWHQDVHQRPLFDHIISKLHETVRQLDPGVTLQAGDWIK